MGVIDAVRHDIAEFFDFLVEKGLAKDTYDNGTVEVTSARWILTNIAEILSTENVVCDVVDDKDEDGVTVTSRLRICTE